MNDNKIRIAISADSTIDLNQEYLDKYNINVVPFTVLLGDTAKLDGKIQPQEIFNYVAEYGTLPKTSAVNDYQFEEHFNKLKENYDAIIHFSLSSDMSSAYFNATNVANEMKNVYVIDSKSLSSGIALLAIYARKLIDKGLPVQKIVQLVKARVNNVQASFVLGRLDYLYKGGRCNSLQFIGANLLRLRPQIVVKDGKMVVGKKFRGKMSEAAIKYVEATLEEFNKPDLSEVFITYTTATEILINEIKKKLTDYGFKNIHIQIANATISSHCGENCLGILYINDAQ